MIGILMALTLQALPVVELAPAVITNPLPAIAWKCEFHSAGVGIAGTFDAVAASQSHPVTNPQPKFTVTSDPVDLISGSIDRQRVHGGNYFVQLWTGSQIRALNFNFGDFSGKASVKYSAGGSPASIGDCHVRKLGTGERA